MKTEQAVYGPVIDAAGRRMLTVPYADGTTSTMTEMRYEKEHELGRHLRTVECVDSEGRVVSKSLHSKRTCLRKKLAECTCAWCGVRFLRDPKDLRSRAKEGKAGPFCDKRCAARYRAAVRWEGIDPFEAQRGVPSRYYQAKNPGKIMDRSFRKE